MKDLVAKDIGIGVPTPAQACADGNCPFHGKLSVRGQLIAGKVATSKMQRTVVVLREYTKFISKYERYEKRRSKIPAHLPDCIKVSVGDEVTIMECRPLSKTVSFCVVAGKAIAKPTHVTAAV